MPAPKIGNLAFPGGFLNYLYIPKSVVIYNPKLGIILIFLRLYVIIFLLAEYTTDLSWTLAHVTPEGFVSYWASPDWSYYRHTVKAEAQESMCRNANEFRYKWDDKDFQPAGCIDLLPGDTWIKGDSSMFIPTYLQDSWIEQDAGPELCDKLRRCCGAAPEGDLGGGYTCKDHGFLEGTFEMLDGRNTKGEQLCRCQKKSSFFVRGADGLKITLHPSFVAEFPHGREAGTTTNPHDHILTLVTIPELDPQEQLKWDERNRGTKANGGDNTEAKVPGEVGQEALASSLLELEAGEDSAPPEPRAAPAIMRRPRKGSPARASDSLMVDMDSVREAGQTIAEAMQIGANALADEAGQLYEEATSSGSRMVRREDIAAAEVQTVMQKSREREEQAEASESQSWASYLQEKVWKKPKTDVKATNIKAGDPVEMSLEAWLEHAMVVEGQEGAAPVPLSVLAPGDGEFLLDAENQGVHLNEIEGTKHKYPTFRVTGVELTFDMKWKNPRAHQLKHNSTVLEIEVLARGGWHTQPQAYHIEPQDPVTGRAKMVLRSFSGISIRFQSSGQFSYFSFVAVATAISAMIVYVGLPALLVNFIATMCLGNASSYYWLAANQVLDPRDMMLGMCARAVALQKALGGQLTQEKLKETMLESFKTSSSLPDEQVEKNVNILSKMLIAKYGKPDEGLITGAQLTDTALSDEPIHMDDAAPMWIRDKNSNNFLSRVMEYLFVNNEDEQMNAVAEEFQDITVELTKAPDQSLGLDVDFSEATGSIIVTGIHPGGLFDVWNQANPEKAVKPGDKFVSVNNKSDSVDQMMKECKTATNLEIRLTRKAG